MSVDTIVAAVQSREGTLVLAPEPGGPFPEIAWGDFFFYYAPDGEVPTNTQPFATIVTKDYPDDDRSNLDPEGRWRVNIHVGSDRFRELTGHDPRDVPQVDFARADAILPHPVYGALGWVCVVTPLETMPTVLELVLAACEDARLRMLRRTGPSA